MTLLKPNSQWRTWGIAVLGIFALLGGLAMTGRWPAAAGSYPAFVGGVGACVGFVAARAYGEFREKAKVQSDTAKAQASAGQTVTPAAPEVSHA